MSCFKNRQYINNIIYQSTYFETEIELLNFHTPGTYNHYIHTKFLLTYKIIIVDIIIIISRKRSMKLRNNVIHLFLLRNVYKHFYKSPE